MLRIFIHNYGRTHINSDAVAMPALLSLPSDQRACRIFRSNVWEAHHVGDLIAGENFHEFGSNDRQEIIHRKFPRDDLGIKLQQLVHRA